MAVDGMEYENVDQEPEELRADPAPTQQQLFDLSGKKYKLALVNDNSELYIPNNAKHWKAYKMQQMIKRLEQQAERNPAQFNSGNFLELLEKFESIVREINNESDDVDDNPLDSSELAGNRVAETAREVGERVTFGVDSGVSADNPIAG